MEGGWRVRLHALPLSFLFFACPDPFLSRIDIEAPAVRCALSLLSDVSAHPASHLLSPSCCWCAWARRCRTVAELTMALCCIGCGRDAARSSLALVGPCWQQGRYVYVSPCVRGRPPSPPPDGCASARMTNSSIGTPTFTVSCWVGRFVHVLPDAAACCLGRGVCRHVRVLQVGGRSGFEFLFHVHES